jgi:ribosomal-protein-serine acetyltransferase
METVAVTRWPASELKTKRLVIRTWREGDAPEMHRALTESAEHLKPFMPWAADEPKPIQARYERLTTVLAEDATGIASAINGMRADDAVFGVFENERLIGGCGLHWRSTRNILEIGYWVAVNQTNRGIATEIARALTTEAFRNPAIDFVEIHCDRNNTFSARVPQRLGYSLTAEYARERSAPGDYGVGLLFRVDRATWHA